MSQIETATIDDLHRLLSSFPDYCKNLLKIRTKDAGFRTFDSWWPSQRVLWKSIYDDMQAKKPVRKIVLKARQQGISTLTEAIMFWKIATTPNMNGLVLSMDRESASVIFEMARCFYEALPEVLRPMKRYSSKKELVLENPDDKTRPQNPGLRSKIEVETAGKYIPPRGAMFQLVHFSEVAFWPNADEIVPAIIPMVPDLPNTMIVYESTGNGHNNFFYSEWLKAKEGRSVFEPIFIPWHAMPEYSMQLSGARELKELMSSLDDDEKVLIERFNVSPEQLKWRRWKIGSLSDDLDYFTQEYPATEDEAFIYGGNPIFDRAALRRVKTLEPIWRGDIFGDKLRPDEDGLLSIWEEPQEKAEYTIGIDVASGEGADFSCMCVMKKTWPEGLADQVAEWHGKVDPVELGQLAVFLAEYYNNAMLSIELNNHGLTVQVEAQRRYWNFYRWQYFDRIGRTYTQKLGWVTNMSTKPMLVDRTRASIRDGLVGIASEALLHELFNYVRLPDSQSFEAEFGHDDRVMAFMIAVTTLYFDDPNVHYDENLGKMQVNKPVSPEDYRTVHVDWADPRGAMRKVMEGWQNL